jgi:hypothetical protein
MRYALLAYDAENSLDELAAEDKAALHAAHSSLREDEIVHRDVTMVAHYRFRPPRLATTIRLAAEGLLRTDGPASARSASLRALYVLEAEDVDAVAEFATRLPAVQHGVTVEIRPITEPRSP